MNTFNAWNNLRERGRAETDAPIQTPLVHDTGALVPPGYTVQIVTRPQRCALRPVRLYVEPGIAEHFTLNDIVIGNRSQFQQAQSIPCAYFARHDNEGEPNGPTGERILCNTVQTAMDFVLVVTNTSDEPRRFVGTWTCELNEHPLAAKLREAEEFIKREQYGYNLQIEQLRDLVWKNSARYQEQIMQLQAERPIALDQMMNKRDLAVAGLEQAQRRIAQLEADRDVAVHEATASFAQAFDTTQKNLTARIAELEHELKLEKQNPLSAELDRRQELLRDPAGRIVLLESGPSAAQFAPERYRDVDRWQRGAPCTWDPWLGNDE